MSADSIVVTGLGAVSPLGGNLPDTWRRLIGGEDAAAPVSLFDVSLSRGKMAGQVALPGGGDAGRLTRGSRLALPAAREALAMAGLLDDKGASREPWLPVSVSTTAGGMPLAEKFLRSLMKKQRAPRYWYISHYVAQRQVLDLQAALRFRGPVTIIANACASGANAIGHARDLIRAGQAECVLAGGYEPLTELIYYGFDCLQAMTPEKCRPFDQQRTGLMLGEAAAFLVVESAEHAAARGARVLCALGGYGHSTDGHHLTQPQPAGSALVRAAATALRESGCRAEDVAYLNAHGTATPLNDASECAAFQQLFPAGNLPRISSTKAAFGHTLGAAGSLEAVLAIQALLTGEWPVQLHLRTPEPDIAGRLVEPGERAGNVPATMSVNLGFGGSNAALVFTSATTSRDGRKSADKSAHSTSMGIAGMGAVSPAGIGVEALGCVPVGELTGFYSEPTRLATVFRVDPKHDRLLRWQNEPRLRRASPISTFMVEACRQALDAAGSVPIDKVGIVAAFGTGVVSTTRRFYENIVKGGPRMAMPNLFPETVFNSPTSHLAAVLGVTGPCYSLVGDESAWVTAIGVAGTWLANETVDHVLVVGAEEFDPVLLDAYAAVRWLRAGGRYVVSEGAGALLLGRSGTRRITRTVEGFTYQNRVEARQAARECFAQLPAHGPVWRSAGGNWLAGVEEEVLRGRVVLPRGEYLGEAFTASAAWATIRAAVVGGPVSQPVWGQNEQVAALVLT